MSAPVATSAEWSQAVIVSTLSYTDWTSAVRNAYHKAYGGCIGIYNGSQVGETVL